VPGLGGIKFVQGGGKNENLGPNSISSMLSIKHNGSDRNRPGQKKVDEPRLYILRGGGKTRRGSSSSLIPFPQEVRKGRVISEGGRRGVYICLPATPEKEKSATTREDRLLPAMAKWQKIPAQENKAREKRLLAKLVKKDSEGRLQDPEVGASKRWGVRKPKK